jgi:hypothetical protein
MTWRGVHFAIDDDTLSGLLATPWTERSDFVANEIEENWDANFATETDKAWALIHSALQRSDPEVDGLERSVDEPSSWAILGREFVNCEDGYLICLTRSTDVPAISQHLEKIDANDIAEQLKVNIEFFNCERVGPSDADYGGEWYSGLKEFYAKAAEARRHVIFTTDF